MSGEPLTDQQIQELKRDLHALKEELENTLTLSKDSSKPVELDQPIGRLSRMDAIQSQQMAKANRDMLDRRLVAVKKALTRVDSDEFGECTLCGEYIGYNRLKVKPESFLCLECQSSKEHN